MTIENYILFGQLVVLAAQALLFFGTLRAAKLSADAAKKSADALPEVERAYLFFEACIMHDLRPLRAGETTAGFNVRISLKNYGKTPAIINGIRKDVCYVGNSDPHGIPDKTASISPELVLAAGETKKIETILVITSEDYNHALDRIGQIFLISNATYKDIFGNPHRTGACFQFDPVLGQWSVCPDKALNYRS